ncbi:MAG TPA: tetratricopeptide repeat protein [Steroidobacteraceae bacterium]|nr:tetratricopeptide repeat protein [Steroidobacteraceae bacterium]
MDAPAPAATTPPSRAQIDELIALFSAGRYPEAEASAASLAERHPRSGPIWKILGAARAMQGKPALAALERAAELLPSDHEAHGNLGNALRAAGRPIEAAASHRRAIHLNPRHAGAHNDLGAALRDLGQLDAALASFRQALRLKPDLSIAAINLGDALKSRGQWNEAAASYRQALRTRPQDAELHDRLGVVLQELGQLDEAAMCHRHAIEIAPGVAAFHNNLGNALLDLGRPAEAVVTYRRALELKPDSAATLSNLASALKDIGQLEAAAQSYRQALELRPQSAPIYTNLAMVERLQNRTADAEASCLRALRIEPQLPSALALLAKLRADAGRFDEAEALFGKAIAADPECAEAWSGVAGLRKMSSTDAAWLAGAQRVADKRLSCRREAHLRYAIGKYYDDVRDYPSAFASYRRANELAKLHGQKYDPQHFARKVDSIIRRYDRDWLSRVRGQGVASPRPVFIVGMPRSGTTLAEQILASHPDAFGANELTFWTSASAAHGALPASGDDDGTIRTLGEDYLRLLDDVSPHAARVVDKMPANIFCLGLIHAALPEARIIHMRRNPIDTCLSIYFQDLERAYAFAHDLDDLAHHYGEYERVVAHWRSALPAESVLEVRYESLVSDQETWSRRMVEFIGLPWNPACLVQEQTARVVTTLSNWQVRQKIHRGSVERWRNYADYAGPLMYLADPAASPGAG